MFAPVLRNEKGGGGGGGGGWWWGGGVMEQSDAQVLAGTFNP